MQDLEHAQSRRASVEEKEERARWGGEGDLAEGNDTSWEDGDVELGRGVSSVSVEKCRLGMFVDFGNDTVDVWGKVVSTAVEGVEEVVVYVVVGDTAGKVVSTAGSDVDELVESVVVGDTADGGVVVILRVVCDSSLGVGLSMVIMVLVTVSGDWLGEMIWTFGL